jgi:pyroglutamyl-peptidase
MARPLALLTGFGPFLDVEENPSGLIAEAIGKDAPPGLDVKSGILPVSYRGVMPKLRELLNEEEREPVLILGMGVHAGSSFRLESRARSVMSSTKLDNDGVLGRAVSPLSAGERATRVDMELAAELLSGVARMEVEISEDAGGYVCECTYHAILSEALRIDSRGLFLHVPSLDIIPLTEQVEVVRSFLGQFVPALRYGCAVIDPT